MFTWFVAYKSQKHVTAKRKTLGTFAKSSKCAKLCANNRLWKLGATDASSSLFRRRCPMIITLAINTVEQQVHFTVRPPDVVGPLWKREGAKLYQTRLFIQSGAGGKVSRVFAFSM